MDKATHLQVLAQTNQLDCVLQWIEEALALCHLPQNVLMKALIVAEEIFVNICHYAYTPQVGMADIYCTAHETTVQLCFVDSGTPFNPLQHQEPNTSLPTHSRQEGGLGIHMVKNLVSKLDYERKNGQNRLCINMEK